LNQYPDIVQLLASCNEINKEPEYFDNHSPCCVSVEVLRYDILLETDIRYADMVSLV